MKADVDEKSGYDNTMPSVYRQKEGSVKKKTAVSAAFLQAKKG
jgi:hypothetical protein